jgi:nitrite reductase (NADH) large subunit
MLCNQKTNNCTAEKIKQWANALPKTIANPWKTTDHRKSA